MAQELVTARKKQQKWRTYQWLQNLRLQNSERTLQVTDFSVKWAREFAEQSLNQTKIALVGFWQISKKIADDLEKQSSAVRQHTTAFAEKTFLNTLDFGRNGYAPKNQTNSSSYKVNLFRDKLRCFRNRRKSLGKKRGKQPSRRCWECMTEFWNPLGEARASNLPKRINPQGVSVRKTGKRVSQHGIVALYKMQSPERSLSSVQDL